MNKQKNKKKERVSEKGLTLLELLATIAILVATVTTVLALGNRAVSQSGLFSAYTQASFLAKEGMELLNDDNIRSEIWDQIGASKEYWEIDYRGESEMTKKTSKNDCGDMWINSSGEKRFYDHEGGGEETPFSRCIILEKEDEKLMAEVEVSFNYRNREYFVNLYRIFYQ